MRYKWDKKYLYWGITAFSVIVAAILFNGLISGAINIGGFFSTLSGALAPLVYGFTMAYLMNPVEGFFERAIFKRLTRRSNKKNPLETADSVMFNNRKRSRVYAVSLSMLALVLVLCGVLVIIIPQLVDTIQRLINNMSGYVQGITDWANRALADYPDVREWINVFLADATTMLTDWLKNSLVPQMSDIMTTVSAGIYSVVQVFFNFFFGFVIAIYFLYNKELFAAQLKKVLFSFASPRQSNAVLRNMRTVHRTFGGFLSGKIIDSLIIGLLFFIILTVFNFPYALLCSVIMGIFNIIPVFGPFIGAVPCALLVLLEDPIYFLYFIAVVVIVQQLDGNVIGPKILGESTGLSSFWVIFSLLLGQSLFGFVGLIIGIPLFAVIYSIFRSRVGRKLRKRGLPDDSNVYRKVAYVDENTGELITLYEVNEQLKIDEQRRQLEKQTKTGFLKRKLKSSKAHHSSSNSHK